MNQNTNYSNFSNQVDNPTDDVNITGDEINEKPIVLIGVVTGCKKLNVRQEPDKDSKVLCVIDRETEVQLPADYNENNYFYKICTSEGVIGYCMKQYIMLTAPKN